MDKKKGAKIALAASVAILGLMRIPAVGVNEVAMFAARAAMAAAMYALAHRQAGFIRWSRRAGWPS